MPQSQEVEQVEEGEGVFFSHHNVRFLRTPLGGVTLYLL
jgi:hypothetical protein